MVTYMKLKDKFNEIKNEKKECIVLLKNGNFYVSFNDDAYILNYLCNYSINDLKVGFPLTSLLKVIEIFENNHINYCVYDYSEKYYNDNRYKDVLSIARKKYFNKINYQTLLNQISYLLDSDDSNYYKIKSFIDEF